MNATQSFPVDLPSGGQLQLQSAEEQDLWNTSHESLMEDYHFSKHNDLILVGALLQQQVLIFRAQRRMNGMTPEVDGGGVPTGRYVIEPVDSDEVAAANKQLTGASDQVQKLEKSLGIDKATREAGGSHTLSNYITTLKKAANERGIHIVKRTLEFEEFVNGLRWRLRVLANADAEDKAYMDVTPDKVLAWCADEVNRLEQVDKDHSRDKMKLYAGKL